MSATSTSNDAELPSRVAVVSFLFNWPSTGGGNIHTVELCHFLNLAGHRVKHFWIKFDPWHIGNVNYPLQFPNEGLSFDAVSWSAASIQAKVRRAVEQFEPNYVIITDSWNFKPLLAEAVNGYCTILRFQALELLCPLNNLRLLVDDQQVYQCPLYQLATPRQCKACVERRGSHSGALHQVERLISGFGTDKYYDRLVRTLHDAHAVLALNPEVESLLRPFAPRVRVVPWGMDPDRFPPPDPVRSLAPSRRLRVFQAGLVTEFIKGFHVLRAAGAELWKKRQDFEFLVTGDPTEEADPWARYVGWVSQADLPRFYQESDIVVVPTIAQEGLSRTSVEAMAAGRPVVASRIGGLPFTVEEGVTGLLCEPGDAGGLARTIERLFDDAELRRRMGEAGRRRFEQEFTWPVVIERYYRPLLAKRGAVAATTCVSPTREGSACVVARSPIEQAYSETLVGVVVHDRARNAARWLRAWHRSEHGTAQIFIVHNQSEFDPVTASAVARGTPDYYLPRSNDGFDVGAFQDVVRGRYDDVLPGWRHLLWCTDDFLPLRPDFLRQFLLRALDAGVGLVAGRYGYWPGHFSGLESERHCRTVGFLIGRDVAMHLRFPAERVSTRQHCYEFEHRHGHLMSQVLKLGFRVEAIDDDEAKVMWDSHHEGHLDQWEVFDRNFPLASGGES